MGYPEYQYQIKSANDIWMAASTTPTQNNKGSFAFFAADGDNAYKIYSIDQQKWVSYDKSNTSDNCKNFATLVDLQDDANAWKITSATRSGSTVYQIQPYNNDGTVTARYWNWNGGVGSGGGYGYNYDDGKTVGIWRDNAAADGGSAWILVEHVDAISEITDFVNSDAYTFVSERGWMGALSSLGYVVSTARTQNNIAATDIKRTNPNFQWTVYTSQRTGSRYLYNIGKGMFMGVESRNNTKVPFVETPAGGNLTFKKSSNAAYPIMFSTDNTTVVNHTKDYDYGLISWDAGWNILDDTGSNHKVVKVGFIDDEVLANIEKCVAEYELRESLAKLDAAILKAKTCTKGTNVGEYSAVADFSTELASIETFRADLTAETTQSDVENKAAEALALITLNLPEDGKYYRLAYDFGNNTVKYVQGVASGVSGKANAMLMTEDKDVASIFYYSDNKLRSYTAGKYVKEDGGTRGLVAEGGEVTFEAGSAIGKIAVKAPSYMHANSSGNIYFVDHCSTKGDPTHTAHDFIVEEVTELPVAHINNVGYTTLEVAKAAALATTEAVEIVLLAGSDETIVFPANVTINKNGFTADNLAVAVAKIGDVLYATLAEAANFATKGQTVTILRSTDEKAVFAYGVVIEKAEGVVAPNATNEVAVDVPADVVGNIVNNSGVETETVNGVVGALQNNEAVISNTPTNLPVGAKLVVTLVNIIFESEAPAKVVYDVTPKKDGAKVEPENAITFRLPVPANWKYAKVYHEGTALEGIYPVQEGNYVEVASQDFSEFAVEIAEPVAKIGDVDYYTFEAALAAATEGQTITLVADVTCTEKPVFNNGGVVNVDINGHKFVSSEKARVRCVASADGTVASNNIKFVRGFGWEAYYNADEKFRVFPTLDEAVAYKSGTNAANIYPYEDVVQDKDITFCTTGEQTSTALTNDAGYKTSWDLNGFTVLQETAVGNPLESTVLGEFTLLDSSAEKEGKWIAGAYNGNTGGGPAFIVNRADAHLILQGGTISIARNGDVVNTDGLIITNYGTLTVDGATLQCDDTYGVMAWGGKVVVNSGEFVMGENGAYSVFASKYYADASVEVNTAIDGYLRISSTATATVNAAGVKYVADGTNYVAPAVGEGLIALDGQVYVPAVDVPENVVGNIVSNNSGNSNVTEDAVTAIVNNIYNNGAVIKYVPTNIPDGAKLVVELKNVIFKSASTVPATVVYDVTPKKDGAKVEPENAITFRLPVPESWAGKYTKVYHAGTALEGMYPVQEGNYVEVASQDFSEFAVETVDYIVLPDGVDSSNCAELFGDNTVTDGTNYYATLQAAVEAVAGQANAVLYCKPGADVGSLQHAPVTSTLTVYGNGADVTGDTERDFDLGNTDPSGGKDITADMTLTVKHLNGCGAWGTKATEHTVNLVFENCANMGKVFISGTTGTLNITMTDCAFEGVIKEAVYSNADGAITLTNVAFSNLNKAVNLNHKAAGTQTVTINGCTFTNCGADVAADQIPVRVLSSVEGGKSVLSVTGSTFTGTPEGGADILLDYGVGLTTASVSGTAANVVVEKENNVGTTTAVKAEETVEFTTALPVAQVGETKYMTLAEAVAAVEDGGTITMIANETFTENNRYDNGGWWDGLGYSGDKSFTIDLNNFTISQDGALNDYLMWFKNDGAKDNTITLKNGTLDAGTTAYCALATASSNAKKITVNLENISLINNNSNGSTVKVRGGAVLNVKDGTVITGKDSYLGVECSAATVNIYDGAEIYMNGTSSYNGCLAGAGGNGTINVYGGKGLGKSGGFIAMTSGGTINVEGGEWTANTDGAYANDNKSVLVAQSDKQYNAGAGNSIVNVTGGTFKGGYNCYGNAAGDAQINISGGNFNADPATYLAQNYVAVENNGVWNVELAVAKIGDTYYATLQAAFDAVKDGETITLIDNVTVSVATAAYNDGTYIDGVRYTGDKSFTVDFNGKTVTDDGCVNDYLIYINNKGEKASEITFTNGTIVSKNGCWSAVCVNSSAATQNVVLNLNGMNITNSNDAEYSGNPVVRVRNLATVNVNDKTVITSNGASYGVAANTDGSTLNINEGATIVQQNSGTTGGNSVFAAVGGKGVINIKGGTITSDKFGVHTMTTGTPVINISGGTITAPVALKSSTNGGNGELATINVTGGTINGTLETYTENGKIVVSGGTFSAPVNEAYCAEGFVPKDNGDGTYGVEEKVELPEVVITDIKDSLTDSDPDLTFALNFAIKDIENLTDEYLEKLFAQYGDWYTDYVLTISGLTDENVTFNANGNGDGYLAGQYDAWSENWVSVPFEDVTLANNESIYIMEYAAKLMNKQGLRFTLAEVAEIVQNFDCGVYFTPEFLAANPGLKVDLHLKVFTEDAEGNKVNDINVATNNFDVENYVAIVHADGKQTKYCTTLADAVAAATDGATVTMLSNVELTEAVKVVGKAITLDLNGKTVSGTCNSNQGHLIYIENGAGLTVKDGAANGGGKLTYAQGTSNVGWTVAVMGNLTLESGTIELTGSWNIGYAVDVRPNAWGVAYTAPSVFTMNGGNVVSSDGAVRVASSSSDTYADVSASFVMNGGKIDAAWDGVFIQQSNAAYDVLNFTINGGTIESDLNPVRVYGPAPTSYVNGQECMSINFNGGTMTYTGTETREWVIDGVLRVGGGSSIETIVENGNITAGEAFAQAQALPEGYIWEQDGETYKVVEAPKAPEVVDGKIEFVDGEFDKYTNDTDIEDVEITYKRTIDSDWNALYVPFAIPASELLADFDIAYINDVRETDEDDDGELDGWQMELIKIKKETAVLRANHPYFVRSKSADYDENNLSLTLTTTLYKATAAEFECSSVYSTYTIKGLNELRASTEFGDADRVLGYDNGETTWGKMADGYSLKPFRFYLTITNHDGSPVVSSSAQMSIVVRDEDGTTGIGGIYGDENGETIIFDLYGRRVLEPEKGNIYIINGKKVLVK